MLAPVEPFLLAGWREVGDVAEEREALGARGQREGAGRGAGGEETLEEVEGEAADGEVGEEVQACHYSVSLFCLCVEWVIRDQQIYGRYVWAGRVVLCVGAEQQNGD